MLLSRLSTARSRAGLLIAAATQWAAGLLFCGLLVINVTQVTVRALGEGMIWVTDLSQLMLLWMVMMGTVAAYCSNEHILTGYLDSRLDGYARALLLVVLRLLEIVFFLILLVAGYSVASVRAEIPYVQLGISTGWTYASIPTAGALLLLAAAALPLHRPEPDVGLDLREMENA
ncbi:MAG: TRAP transporter small permease [Nocardioidaceae bacterium]